MSILVPALIFGIYSMLFIFYMGLTRRKAVLSRQMNPDFYKTYSDGQESERLRLLTRHCTNLFETPILFYVIVVMIHTAGATSTLFVSLAWAYVLLRFAHAFVHLGTNFVLHRFLIFGLSLIVLLVMWVLMLIRLLPG